MRPPRQENEEWPLTEPDVFHAAIRVAALRVARLLVDVASHSARVVLPSCASGPAVIEVSVSSVPK